VRTKLIGNNSRSHSFLAENEAGSGWEAQNRD
jgi:hypothetical protein